MTPPITFVIPSYNGFHKLPIVLHSIFSDSYQQHINVVVVVDGSTDGSIEWLMNYQHPSLKIEIQSNKGRAIARNTGVAASPEGILFFLDDDMRLAKHCLHTHTTHHSQYQNSILVGKVMMDAKKCTKDFHRYLTHLYQKWDTGWEKKQTISPTHFKFTSCHVSMPKSVLEALGGFDSRLNDAEDYDLGMRALEAGISVYFDPEAIAYHDDFPSCRQYIKRQLQYKASHQKLNDLGKVYQHDVFKPLRAPKNLLKRRILKFLKSDRWVNRIDEECFLFLPKKIRYRWYATIIYAQTLKGLGMI